ncbi:DgyrCDS1326 [Dimorphilus gyrociliatus]|nr:DgyrCDS1326 [Dimorphilus gyrociliatus]
MDNVTNIESIERAISELYNGSTEQRSLANQWLIQVQLSPDAWKFCWKLLDFEKAFEVQFFGACTLYVKISKFWGELNSDSEENHEIIEQLRLKLFDIVVKYSQSNGLKAVAGRLTVAFSSFILHSVTNIWKTAIDEIFANLATFQNETMNRLFLEILTSLPEELNNGSFMNRVDVISVLRQHSDRIFNLLSTLLNSSDNQFGATQALKCFSSWITISLPLQQIAPTVVEIFKFLFDITTFDAAVETLCNIFSHGEVSTYKNTIYEFFFPKLDELFSLIVSAQQNNDSDTCHGLTRIITTLADSSISIIKSCAASGEEARIQRVAKFLELVLQCSRMPGFYPIDEQSSDMPFTFWYNLQDEIWNLSAQERTPEVMSFFQGYYFQLVDVILVKTVLPPKKVMDTWGSDEMEGSRCYRQDVGDVVMYMYNVLHTQLLKHICERLSTFLQNTDTSIQYIEAALFLLRSVADAVDLEETTYIPAVFELLPRLPQEDCLIQQSLFVISSFAEWLSNHPDILYPLKALLIRGLIAKETALPASLALKEILREHQHCAHEYAEDVLQAIFEVFQANSVGVREQNRLASCAALIIAVLPFDDARRCADTVLSPKFLEFQVAASSPNKYALAVNVLNIFSGFFYFLNVYTSEELPHSPKNGELVIELVSKLLPSLKVALETHQAREEIVQATCTLFKRAIRSSLNDFSALFSDTTSLIIQLYPVKPHASVLDLSSQLLTLMVSDEGNYREMAQRTFCEICSYSLKLFEGTIDPDIAEAFMSFLGLLVRRSTDLFLTINNKTLMEAAIFCASAKESGTVKQACFFLTNFISAPHRLNSPNHPVRQAVGEYGRRLVNVMIGGIAGNSPRIVVDSFAEVITALNKYEITLHSAWLKAACEEYDLVDKAIFASRILR